MGQVVLLMRMLRLLRVLRLVRLVKAVRPLFILAVGVVKAMQSVFWVLVLVLAALYIAAILVTRIIGHGDFPEDAKKLFDSVPTSMFTLFAIMNGQEWVRIEPFVRDRPVAKFAFVIFVIISSWALL